MTSRDQLDRAVHSCSVDTRTVCVVRLRGRLSRDRQHSVTLYLAFDRDTGRKKLMDNLAVIYRFLVAGSIH